MGFLVLRTLRSCIVVNQEVSTLANASRNFAALAFNISFQLVAVLVMMHISGYDESQPLAFISRFYGLLLLDNQLGQQMLHMLEMNIVLEPGDKLGTLFSGPMPSMLANSSSNMLRRAVSISSFTL